MPQKSYTEGVIQTALSLPVSLRRELEDVCTARGLTRTEAIRTAIEAWLGQNAADRPTGAADRGMAE